MGFLPYVAFNCTTLNLVSHVYMSTNLDNSKVGSFHSGCGVEKTEGHGSSIEDRATKPQGRSICVQQLRG